MRDSSQLGRSADIRATAVPEAVPAMDGAGLRFSLRIGRNRDHSNVITARRLAAEFPVEAASEDFESALGCGAQSAV